MFNFDPKSSPYDKPAVEKSSDPSVRFTKKGKTEGHDVKFQKAKPNPNIPRPKSPPPISERKLEKNVKLNPKEKELPQIGHQKDAASKSPSPMSPQIKEKKAASSEKAEDEFNLVPLLKVSEHLETHPYAVTKGGVLSRNNYTFSYKEGESLRQVEFRFQGSEIETIDSEKKTIKTYASFEDFKSDFLLNNLEKTNRAIAINNVKLLDVGKHLETHPYAIIKVIANTYFWLVYKESNDQKTVNFGVDKDGKIRTVDDNFADTIKNYDSFEEFIGSFAMDKPVSSKPDEAVSPLVKPPKVESAPKPIAKPVQKAKIDLRGKAPRSPSPRAPQIKEKKVAGDEKSEHGFNLVHLLQIDNHLKTHPYAVTKGGVLSRNNYTFSYKEGESLRQVEFRFQGSEIETIDSEKKTIKTYASFEDFKSDFFVE